MPEAKARVTTVLLPSRIRASVVSAVAELQQVGRQGRVPLDDGQNPVRARRHVIEQLQQADHGTG